MTFTGAARVVMFLRGSETGADVARFHGDCTRIQAEGALKWLEFVGEAESNDPPRTRFDAPPRRWRLTQRRTVA